MTQSSDVLNSEAISTHMEQADQQLRLRLAQLVHDTKQSESPAENAAALSTSAGYRLAIRGAILTDLRRMLDEVHDIIAMTSHPSLSKQVQGVSER